MTSLKDTQALERLSTKGNLRQAAESAMWLLFFLGLSIGLAYFLVYGEPRFDRIHAEFGVSRDVSEIAFWCVVLVLYGFAIMFAWILKSEIKTYRLGHRCAFFFAVLLTTPVGLAVLLIGVPSLWDRLNSMAGVVVIFFGFLSWQRWVMEDNYKKYLAIVNILTEIQQSVGNIEKEKTEPRAGWVERERRSYF